MLLVNYLRECKVRESLWKSIWHSLQEILGIYSRKIRVMLTEKPICKCLWSFICSHLWFLQSRNYQTILQWINIQWIIYSREVHSLMNRWLIHVVNWIILYDLYWMTKTKANVKIFMLCNSIYIAFLKGQNYGNEKQIRAVYYSICTQSLFLRQVDHFHLGVGDKIRQCSKNPSNSLHIWKFVFKRGKNLWDQLSGFKGKGRDVNSYGWYKRMTPRIMHLNSVYVIFLTLLLH